MGAGGPLAVRRREQLGGLVRTAGGDQRLGQVAGQDGPGVAQQPGVAGRLQPLPREGRRLLRAALRVQQAGQVVEPAQQQVGGAGRPGRRHRVGQQAYAGLGVGLQVAAHGAERHQRVLLDVGRADLPGDLHRPLGQRDVLLGGVLQHPGGRAQREHLGLHGGRLQALDQPLGVGEFGFVAGPVQVAEHPGAVHPEPGGPGRAAHLVHQLQRALREAQPALAVTAAAGRDHGLGQYVDQPQPLAGRVVVGARHTAAGRVGLGPVVRAQGVLQDLVGDLVPEFEGAFQHPQLLGEGVAPAGGPGRVQRARQGAGTVVRVVPVVGQPGRAVLGADQCGLLGQHGGVAAVDPVALAGKKVVRDRLADQRVPEPVAVPVGVRAQDAGADGGAQRLDQCLLAVVQYGGEQRVLDVGAALGRDSDDPLGVLGQRLDPDEQDVAQRVREPGRAALPDGGGEFLNEERVALGAAVDAVDQLAVRGGGAEDAGQLLGHLAPAEARQLQALHDAQPLQLHQERPQRVAAVQVVGAVGGDDQDAGPVQGAQQVGEQFPGRAVGPVQVLHGEHQGAVRAQPLEQAGGVLEEVGPPVLVVGLPVGLAEVGEQPGEVALHPGGGRLQLGAQRAVQPAQRGGQRRVRQALGADLRTAAERGHHAVGIRALAGLVQELLQQPGLADPRLPADQDGLRPALPRPAQRRGQHGDLGATADEDGTHRYLLHEPEHAIGLPARPSAYCGPGTADGGGAGGVLPLNPLSGT